MAEKKKFLNTKVGKIVLSLVAVVVVSGAASTMVACQGKETQTDIPTNNLVVDNGITTPTEQKTEQKTEQQTGSQQQEQKQEEQQQSGGEQKQEEQQGGNGEEQQGGEQQQQGGNQGGEQQEVDHEAEYKQMFLENLPKAIEDYYNENVAAFDVLYISGTKVKEINLSNNKIYIEASQVNKTISMSLTTDILSNPTFEGMYGALENFSGEFSKAQKVVDQQLADEIGAFALDQQAVKDYLSENGITYSNYSVISASEFESSTNGRTSNVKINLGDRIVDLSIYCSTGAKSTQEEYLEAFKDFKDYVSVVFNSVEEYQGMKNEIDVAFTEELITELTSDAYINEHFENTGTGMAMKNFELAGRTNVPTFEFNY